MIKEEGLALMKDRKDRKDEEEKENKKDKEREVLFLS